MAQLLVTVNDRALVATLQTAIARGGDVRPALERIADDFLRMEQRQFASEGSAGGAPWQPLSPGWAARRRSTGGILEGRNPRLARSLTTQRARGSRRDVNRRSLIVGSRHPLAHLHQGGTGDRYLRTYRGKPLAKPRYAGRLPARPVVTVGPRDEQRWRGILADWLLSNVRSLGL